MVAQFFTPGRKQPFFKGFSEKGDGLTRNKSSAQDKG
jgi:hypothetical protein